MLLYLPHTFLADSCQNFISSKYTKYGVRSKPPPNHQFFFDLLSVSKYLIKQGFIFDEKNPQAVLLTFDTELNYTKLTTFTNLSPTPVLVTDDISNIPEQTRVFLTNAGWKILIEPRS